MKKLSEEQRVLARKETMRKAHKKYQEANREKINAYQNRRNAKIREAKRMEQGEEEEKQTEKLKIMAGVKWREEGERSTKFFLNAVTAKQVSSTLDYLSTEQGNIHDINSIVDHAKEFYRTLHTKKDCQAVDDFYQHCPKLDEQAKADLNNPITIVNLK